MRQSLFHHFFFIVQYSPLLGSCYENTGGLNAIWRGVGFLQLVLAYDLFSNFTFSTNLTFIMMLS